MVRESFVNQLCFSNFQNRFSVANRCFLSIANNMAYLSYIFVDLKTKKPALAGYDYELFICRYIFICHYGAVAI